MTEKFTGLLVTTVVMAFAQADLFIALSELRCDRKRCVIAAAVFAVVTAAVCMVGAVLSHGERPVGWMLLGCTAPMMVFFFCVSQYRDVRFFVTYGVAVVSIAVVDMFGYLVVLLACSGDFMADWAVRSVSMILWELAVKKIIGDRWRRALELMQGGWWLLLLTVGGMYAILCLLAAYPTPIAQRPEDVSIALVIVTVMALAIVMGIRMVYTMLKVSRQQEQSRNLQTQLSMAKERYAMLSESVRSVRLLRHDMKYHISVIYGLLNRGDYDRLNTYMRRYYEQLTLLDREMPLYTKNHIINILAGYYARRGEEQGIECRMDIRVPNELPIDEAHLVALLGNMWRNALDACGELPKDTHRFFHTVICVDGNKLIVKCKNSAPVAQQNENGIFSEAKEETHENGLESMISIVEEYNGFYTIQMENGSFTFAAALVIK